ncbi:hypothetical protein [Streptomyces hyaluromycini]|uniref:hypothetical protein n=1 Tax=Streptomyces hyaluromycini TaxID=1377993 RepID=UPI0011AE951B|nr:hypothetical protein [Streptomyces hyaluromycini]
MCGLHALPESGVPMPVAGKSPRGRSNRLGPVAPDVPPAGSPDGAAGRADDGPAVPRRSSDDGSVSSAARRGRSEVVGSDPGCVRRDDGPGPWDSRNGAVRPVSRPEDAGGTGRPDSRPEVAGGTARPVSRPEGAGGRSGKRAEAGGGGAVAAPWGGGPCGGRKLG